ncbi:MAG TPA: sodium:proton antiporter [Gammaproteobacteria bacterium]|nr:sodium:proton antiporter [Gammaproteobacteria bacterium]
MTPTESEVHVDYSGTNRNARPLLVYGFIFLTFALLAEFHAPDEAYGVLSLLPVCFTIVAAIVTRRALEPLLAGVIAGILLLDSTNLFTQLGSIATNALSNETIVWIILVCGMMSGIIVMLERGGSVLSFGDFLAGRIKTKRRALLTTSALGILVFIDDYLNALAVSSSMKSTTDRFNVSREKLSFIVDSTAVPVCILVPISTWAVFFTALLEENKVAVRGEGILLYLESIPYMFYGWLALLLVWLVAMGYLKDMGGMKQAELRAQAGQPIPRGAQVVGFNTSNIIRKSSTIMGLLNFFLPMTVLVAATVYYDIDLLLGALVASIFTMTFYMVQRLMSFNQLVESMLDGFKIMLLPFAIVAAGYMLKDVNDSLGMTPYIMDLVLPYVSKELFAAIIFVVMALIVFATSSAWGMFVISLPIVVPLAQGVDASMPLVIGALMSAAAFGSHACFYGVSTLLSAQGSECTTMQHALTQLPYALLAGALSIILLVVAGYMLA